MADIKDSNALELKTVINPDAIQQDKLGALDDLDASLAPPSEYKKYNRKVFGDDGSNNTLSDTGESESMQFFGKDSGEDQGNSGSNPTGSSDDSGDSGDSDGSDDSSSVGGAIIMKKVKGIVNLNEKSKPTENIINDGHAEILNEINNLVEKLTLKKIKFPKFKQRDIVKHKSKAAEIRSVLSNLHDDNNIADSFESGLRLLLNILCKTFNGRHTIFDYKIDLKGYNILVMSDLKEIRPDIVSMTGSVRKKIGKLPLKFFLLLKIFIFNLGSTVYSNNQNNEDHVFDDDFDDDEDDDDDDEEEEEEEEED